ncbi:MAG TPA: acyl-CoA dehydrogenase family protein [Candidatus Binatia bacterium]|nr:acyl-CoA dehydrogenase family protein [Candidatus Binatia bacterium]
MDFELSEDQQEIRRQVRALCARFPDDYWRERDESGVFPDEFYRAVADAGWLGVAIPREYGGSGLGITEAALVMQTVGESGGGTQACSSIHLGMFGLEPLIKYGTESAKRKHLPRILSGEIHVSFAVTEPDAGTNTTEITTTARRDGDDWVIHGRKVFITKARESRKMLILTRTTPIEKVAKKTDGMSLFFADIDPGTVEVRELEKCARKSVDTNMLFIDGLRVAGEDLVGEEGKGFRYILDGLNPERILIAAEAIGMARRAIEKAVRYANERIVFGRPIGMNQGIQFPLADAAAKVETAELMVYKAASLFDRGLPCAKEANIAKYMAAQAADEATDRAVQTHGGYGYIKDYDVERYWREARLFRIAPVSQEMVLNYIGEHVLGLPRSY